MLGSEETAYLKTVNVLTEECYSSTNNINKKMIKHQASPDCFAFKQSGYNASLIAH